MGMKLDGFDVSDEDDEFMSTVGTEARIREMIVLPPSSDEHFSNIRASLEGEDVRLVRLKDLEVATGRYRHPTEGEIVYLDRLEDTIVFRLANSGRLGVMVYGLDARARTVTTVSLASALSRSFDPVTDVAFGVDDLVRLAAELLSAWEPDPSSSAARGRIVVLATMDSLINGFGGGIVRLVSNFVSLCEAMGVSVVCSVDLPGVVGTFRGMFDVFVSAPPYRPATDPVLVRWDARQDFRFDVQRVNPACVAFAGGDEEPIFLCSNCHLPGVDDRAMPDVNSASPGFAPACRRFAGSAVAGIHRARDETSRQYHATLVSRQAELLRRQVSSLRTRAGRSVLIGPKDRVDDLLSGLSASIERIIGANIVGLPVGDRKEIRSDSTRITGARFSH